jgi:predicted HTH domain antitoxin
MTEKTVTIELPREVLVSARMTREDLKQELALALYQQGKLSFGQAREISGQSAEEFRHLLGARGIAMHYDLSSYEDDLNTLKELGRL